MTQQELETGLMAFVETYMIPNLEDGMDRWLLYFGQGTNGVRLDNYIKTQAPMLTSLGILHPDGTINLDEVEKSGKAAFKKQPKVKIWKFTLSEADFDVLIGHLRGTRQVSQAAQ